MHTPSVDILSDSLRRKLPPNFRQYGETQGFEFISGDVAQKFVVGPMKVTSTDLPAKKYVRYYVHTASASLSNINPVVGGVAVWWAGYFEGAYIPFCVASVITGIDNVKDSHVLMDVLFDENTGLALTIMGVPAQSSGNLTYQEVFIREPEV